MEFRTKTQKNIALALSAIVMVAGIWYCWNHSDFLETLKESNAQYVVIHQK